MTFDLVELRDAYRREYGRYQRLGDWIAARLTSASPGLGISHPLITARPKDVPSFLKKAMRKGYTDPMRQITDKAGVRVIVSHLADIEAIEGAMDDLFLVSEHQNKADELGPATLGYLGVHFLVTPHRHDLAGEDLDLEGAVCEIQLHTRAQNAWSTISHPLLYKAAGTGPSHSIERRINRLVALVELFDQEVATAREAVMTEPGYRQAAMLQPLEREFIQIAHRDFDPILSLEVLAAIAPAYSEAELDNFTDLIESFVRERRGYIAEKIAQATPDSNPLVSQPEAIAVLERLEHAKERLRVAWDQALPPDLLDSLSEELGRPA